MTTEHPAYRNPTIMEALCEIQFVGGAEPNWSSNRPMPIYKVLEPQFPDMEIIPEANVTLEISDEGPRSSVQPMGQRLRFKNSDGSRLIQIPSSGDVLVFNILKPYPGWAAVVAMIEQHWAALSPALDPQAIIRIGLRYINKVRHSEAAPATKDWIKATDSIPASFVTAHVGSSSRVELKTSENHRSSLTVQSSLATPTEPFGATVIDSDHIWMDPAGCAPAKLSEILNELHESVWTSFSSALTPHYVQYLDGSFGEKSNA